MKINKWIAGIFLAGFLLVFQSGIYAADMKKWSVGASIGASETDLSNRSIDNSFAGNGFTTNAVFSDTETAMNIYIGHKLGPNMGVEVGYSSFGDFGYAGTETAVPAGAYAGAREITGFYGAIVGYFQLNNKFTLIGKFGMAFWDQEGTINNAALANADFVNGSNGKDRIFGMGGDFKITDTLTIRGEWTQLKASENINIMYIGVYYSF